QGGLSDHVAEVWLFDALYARTDKFLAWSDKVRQGRLINIYTENGGTRTETEKMMATLRQRGTPIFSGNESEAKSADLRANRLVFLFTELPHDDVLHGRQTFLEFLKTSCLGDVRIKGD